MISFHHSRLLHLQLDKVFLGFWLGFQVINAHDSRECNFGEIRHFVSELKKIENKTSSQFCKLISIILRTLCSFKLNFTNSPKQWHKCHNIFVHLMEQLFFISLGRSTLKLPQPLQTRAVSRLYITYFMVNSLLFEESHDSQLGLSSRSSQFGLLGGWGLDLKIIPHFYGLFSKISK